MKILNICTEILNMYYNKTIKVLTIAGHTQNYKNNHKTSEHNTSCWRKCLQLNMNTETLTEVLVFSDGNDPSTSA